MSLFAHLFASRRPTSSEAGRLLNQQRILSERERVRETARQMLRDMGKPVPEVLR